MIVDLYVRDQITAINSAEIESVELIPIKLSSFDEFPVIITLLSGRVHKIDMFEESSAQELVRNIIKKWGTAI